MSLHPMTDIVNEPPGILLLSRIAWQKIMGLGLR